MPMDRSKYPSDWETISAAIRERAHNRCEQCGVENGAWILRSVEDGSRYLVLKDGDYYDGDFRVRMSEMDEEFALAEHDTRIVLTVHHKGILKPDGTPGDPHDKMDCRPQNLIALCQRCHLLADMPTHIANRKRSRLAKREQVIAETGQGRLIE